MTLMYLAMKKTHIKHWTSYFMSICAISGMLLFSACGKGEPNVRDNTGSQYGYGSEDDQSLRNENTGVADTTATYDRASNPAFEDGTTNPAVQGNTIDGRTTDQGMIDGPSAGGIEIETPTNRNLESSTTSSRRGILNSDGHNIQVEEPQEQDQQAQPAQNQQRTTSQQDTTRQQQQGAPTQQDTTGVQ
jgi:hypothetical protein